MKSVLGVFLEVYQYIFSTLLVILFGRGCRFVPTCSDYAKDSIELYGAFGGTLKTVKRLSRCHPWGSSGFDPADAPIK